MRPKQGMESCLKHIQAHYIPLAFRGMGIARYIKKKEPEETEFVVDCGASIHMVGKKDLNLRVSRNLTTVMTANGDVQTRDEATVYVKELDLFVTVMLLEETPAILSLGKLCEDHECTYLWTSGPKPQLTKKGKKIGCNKSNFVAFVVLGLSTSSSTSSTPISSTSSSKDSVFDISRYTGNPATERSGSTSEELRGKPLHRSTENQKHK